jgi:hypothetical protein
MRTALARLHMRTHTWTWWQRGFFILLVPWLALLAWGATWQSGSNRMLAYFASAVVLLLWLGAITQPTSRPTSSVQKAAPSAATFTSEPLLPTVSAAALPATTTTQPTTTSWPTATSQSATRSTIISRPTVTPRAVAPPTTRRRPAPPSPPTTRRRPTTTAPQGRCDPHYPGVCIPPYPPDLDCDQVGYRNFRVLAPDPHGFDGNNDGIGCET